MKMSMTIEEAKEHLSQYIGDNRIDYDDLDAIEVAVNVIQKYQRIQAIVEAWKADVVIDSFDCMADIYEVVGNGNNNQHN